MYVLFISEERKKRKHMHSFTHFHLLHCCFVSIRGLTSFSGKIQKQFWIFTEAPEYTTDLNRLLIYE